MTDSANVENTGESMWVFVRYNTHFVLPMGPNWPLTSSDPFEEALALAREKAAESPFEPLPHLAALMSGRPDRSLVEGFEVIKGVEEPDTRFGGTQLRVTEKFPGMVVYFGEPAPPESLKGEGWRRYAHVVRTELSHLIPLEPGNKIYNRRDGVLLLEVP